VVVFEQPGGDQPVSGSVLRRVAERVAGAVLSRTGEGAVQHHRGDEVNGVAGVPQAAGDLPAVKEPWSRPEHVLVVPEPGEDLAGVREGGFKLLQRIDGPEQRPSQTLRELLGGARFPHAGEHRFDGAIIRGPLAIQRVGRAASRMTGCVSVLPVPDDLPEPVDRSHQAG
jgi:hypothetical protein